MDYNWNKKHYKLNKCSIIQIKWYMSEIISFKFTKKAYNWNKIKFNVEKITRDVGVHVKRILNECKWE